MLALATDIFKYFLLAWLGGLAFFVIRDVLLKNNSLSGLLATSNGNSTEPERVVLLFFTIGFALYYSLTALAIPISDLPQPNGRPAMPDISYEVLAVLFGSQSSFILGKILRIYMGVQNNG
ncbi:hypothetical protein [Hoeflea sp.]|uniref:hypothetical protein n=1 Tax=Hoeflea sp. TaxID=1940281 RepID=UPI003B01E22B